LRTLRRSRSALVFAGILFCAVAASAPAHADSWRPYGTRRFADPTGTYYVVISEGEGFDATFTFARARTGTARVRNTSPRDADKTEPEAAVREGDTILASGALANAPLEVRVASDGTGFAAMKEFAGVGRGVSFAWVSRRGEVLHAKRLSDIFDETTIGTFERSISSIWWFRSAWLEDEPARAVVVGAGNVLRRIDLASGAVSPGGDVDVVRALASTDPAAVRSALDVAVETPVKRVDAALAAILDDPTRAVGDHVRAAVALAVRGDRRGKDVVVRAASTPRLPGVEIEDYRYALARLPAFVGEAAIPALRDAMRGVSSPGWGSAQEGFVGLGESAVRALVAMLVEKSGSNDYRGGAAHALRAIGAARAASALCPLLITVRDPQEYVAGAALGAAVEIGGDAIASELIVALASGTTVDAGLASYFKRVRDARATDPLIEGLARQEPGEYAASVFAAALRFQTGEDFGEDASAWRSWRAGTRGR
jgi:hypothetical protein